MSFKIANINYISGPEKLSLLVPTWKFLSYLEPNKNIGIPPVPPILLIGDHHESQKNNCSTLPLCHAQDLNNIDSKEKDGICMNISSTLWFKALDSLCGENSHIDIFIEHFMFPYFLKDSSLFKESDTLLSFLPKYYPYCFSTSTSSSIKKDSLDKDKCPTKYIRYHLSDIRFSPNDIKFLDSEKEKIELGNIFLKHPDYKTLSLKDTFDYVNNKVYKETDIYDDTYKNGLEFSSYKENVYFDNPYHFPTFESYLFFCIEHCLNYKTIKYMNCNFFSNNTLQLLYDWCKNPNQFFEFLFKMDEFSYKSVIQHKIKQSYINYDKCLEICKDYFKFYNQTFSTKQRASFIPQLEFALKYFNSLSTYYNSNKNKPYYRRLRETDNEIYNKEIKMTKEEINNYIEVICPQLGKDILDCFAHPFMDIYFLVSSWSQSYKDSLCSIYIYGTHHMETLQLFLFKKKYYTIQMDLSRHPEQNRWSYDNDKIHMYLKKTILNRCLFTKQEKEQKDWIFEDELTSYWKQYLFLFSSVSGSNSIQINKLITFSKQQYIIKERIKYLSFPYYIKLLSGYKISDEELNKLYNEYSSYITKKRFIQLCHLSTKYDL